MILDEEALINGKTNIIAYFTVSTKALNLREGISKNVRKHLDDLGNKRSSTFVVYLIGQLGKNDAHRSEIDGNELVARAIATIREAYEIVGGRCILIECEPIPGLRKLYEDNGFAFLQESLDNDSLIQLIRFIDA
ncbi:MAG TPA: acetyltransferase [Mesotoga infera]|uniref:Acetyltransferase n=1 Tax=Mesotoga infera TaxID=1236046 RepID=A0A7C1CWI5_9BACT|nr:acetyltransferase [Mesotoga infera]